MVDGRLAAEPREEFVVFLGCVEALGGVVETILGSYLATSYSLATAIKVNSSGANSLLRFA